MKSTSLASVLAVVLSATTFVAAVPTVSAAADTHVAANTTHDTATRVKNAVNEAAHEIKALFVNEKSGSALEPITIIRAHTAEGMIGEDVLSPAGKKIAKVKDIVIDSNGSASMIILSDGGFLGINNKLAAFSYDKVVSQDEDGKVTMALTQAMIDSAADFSYDPSDKNTAKILPEGSISMNDILDGNLFDYKGKDVADIENVSIVDGKAEYLLVGYNKKLGVGGDMAALDFASLAVVKKDGAVNFRMNEAQSNQFGGLKVSSRK